MKFVDLQSQYLAHKEEIDAAIHDVLDSGRFINGRPVDELESTLASFAGTKYAVGTSSGTDGLLLSLMALDIQPGDEVLTTPFTFIATAEAISLLKARPVFVDIDPETFNLDAARAAEVLESGSRAGKRLKGIIPVALYGQCADMDELNDLARSHGLFVIEDACQSFGAEYRGRRSGALSDVGVTSFFPSKPLGGYGDGGMVFTSDATLAARMRALREHGQTARYRHDEIGINARLDTLQAAVVLAKFKHFEKECSRRQKVADTYARLLRKHVPAVRLPVVRNDRTSVYAQYTIRVPSAFRDRAAEFLQTRGIPTSIHYPRPLHLQPAFRNLGMKEGCLPEAEKAACEVLSLPMHPFLKECEQEQVADALKMALSTLL